MISRAKLQTLMRRCDSAKWVDPLESAMAKWGINNPLRAAAFLAQAAVESDELTHLDENLHYKSPERVRAIFKRYFVDLSDADVRGFAESPEMFASRVYANRMGNGPEASGDGWKFRGRGIFQLTGRANYAAYGAQFAASPDLVSTEKYGADSAGWFWSGHGLNAMADSQDFRGITKAINGGYVGWVQRKSYYDIALGLLK